MTIQLLTIVLTVKYRMIKVLVERQAVYYLRGHFLQNLELAFQFVFQLLEKRRLLQLHFHFLLQNSYFLLDLFVLVVSVLECLLVLVPLFLDAEKLVFLPCQDLRQLDQSVFSLTEQHLVICLVLLGLRMLLVAGRRTPNIYLVAVLDVDVNVFPKACHDSFVSVLEFH